MFIPVVPVIEIGSVAAVAHYYRLVGGFEGRCCLGEEKIEK